MSKKQSYKKKISLKLNVDETAIVIPYDVALHIAETYDFVSMETEEEHVQYYKDVADLVRAQANENRHEFQDDEYEEW
jgi:hypothetical protein